ncbi:hypothetical protein EEJ42_14600 [Streptomyces botrytidirepellens]|uniref:Uncharacterized protein n=2 Tax=Streptomyces botrytidirepellens TaxID=2486417 RepID=A0A3M8W8Z4_9ACTN|nr:hypothetical protein EEJ42_14600 [Streptomyces botrytidirepellens]
MRDRHPRLTTLDSNGRPVPDIAGQHAELDEALMLTRLAELEVKRLQLSLIKAARRAHMTTKQRGRPLGLGSRQGILDRERALERELDAASKYVPVHALDDQPVPVELGPAAVRDIAEDLVAHWNELLTDDGEGEDSWMADLTLKLRDLKRLGVVDLTGTDVAAIVGLVRLVVEEIDDQSAATGQPGAATSGAQAVLERARCLNHQHARSRRDGMHPEASGQAPKIP